MNYISIFLAKYHIFHKTFFHLRKPDVTCVLARLNMLNCFCKIHFLTFGWVALGKWSVINLVFIGEYYKKSH